MAIPSANQSEVGYARTSIQWRYDLMLFPVGNILYLLTMLQEYFSHFIPSSSWENITQILHMDDEMTNNLVSFYFDTDEKWVGLAEKITLIATN